MNFSAMIDVRLVEFSVFYSFANDHFQFNKESSTFMNQTIKIY